MRSYKLTEHISVSVIQTSAGKLPVDKHRNTFACGGMLALANSLQSEDAKGGWLNPGMSVFRISPADELRVVAEVRAAGNGLAAIGQQPRDGGIDFLSKARAVDRAPRDCGQARWPARSLLSLAHGN